MALKTHYPSFNVMDEEDEWDDHTQFIVNNRISASPLHQTLSDHEADMLSVICAILMNDNKPAVIRYVLHHIDHTLQSSPGEGQRKVGVPEEKTLIRQGLNSMDQCARDLNATSFLKLSPEDQRKLIEAISMGTATPHTAWENVPQQPFFQKLMNMTIESYCSHPEVWSEIGYAGPAYPRGYVRTQIGILDPWEAKTEE
ncbi:gluconate 2-dehydrogenase subunit 3 family protein [Paenibacillus oryzisoli]|uniref:gluconate 2-dehydrogenase subunit 3 family protein n=1 Tax=Paenibacillus oryzisoli TaxID=1850517 RepID=UPI003D265C8A